MTEVNKHLTWNQIIPEHNILQEEEICLALAKHYDACPCKNHKGRPIERKGKDGDSRKLSKRQIQKDVG